MLSAIRNHTQSFLVKILAALLIGSFAIWGVEDMFNVATSSNSPIYEIGNIEGEQVKIENAVNRELKNLRQMLGDGFGIDEAKALGIVELVLQRQINDSAFLIASRNLGVEISDPLVRQRIRQNQAFQGLGGFDRNRFEQVLRSNSISEGEYIIETRNQMSRNQILDSFSSDTIPVDFVKKIFMHRHEKRNIETIFISDDHQKDIPDPSDDSLIKFHKDHSLKFTSPEFRSVSVIHLKASDLLEKVSVTDVELKEAYEAREDEFLKSEMRQVKQMIFADLKDAQKAVESLAQGQSFALVAKKLANMDESSIDLGKISYAHMPFPKLADVVFALKPGVISSPQKSLLGWHLFKVEKIEPEELKTLDEVKSNLLKIVTNEKAIDSLYELANQLEDTLGGGSSLEESANKLNLKVFRIPSINSNGKSKEGNLIKNIPAGNFLESAFSTDEGSESQLIEAGDDGYFILRVDGITAPFLKPLKTVKLEVSNLWKDSRRAKKAELAAKEIIERINAGEKISAIANELDIKLSIMKNLVRHPSKGGEKIPQALLSQIFELSSGKASMSRNGKGYTIASLKEVIAVNSVSDKTGINDLSGQLSETFNRDIHSQLANALRERFGVKINREAVSNLFSGATDRRLR